jgi:hypothetical protein
MPGQALQQALLLLLLLLLQPLLPVQWVQPRSLHSSATTLAITSGLST